MAEKDKRIPARQKFLSKSPAQTRRIGSMLGRKLKARDVVGIYGELGAGKTTFVKGIAGGMGVRNARLVNSPSFVVMKQYAGREKLYHFDLYRIADSEGLKTIGYEDYVGADGVCAIEWPEKIEKLLQAETCRVSIRVTGERTREIEIREGTSPSAATRGEGPPRVPQRLGRRARP